MNPVSDKIGCTKGCEKNSRGVQACDLGSSMDTGQGLKMSWDWVKMTQARERLGFCAKWLCRAVYGLIDGDQV